MQCSAGRGFVFVSPTHTTTSQRGYLYLCIYYIPAPAIIYIDIKLVVYMCVCAYIYRLWPI